MRQLTYEEAKAFCDSKKWEPMSLAQRANFQIHQDRLCMPFDVFHEAVEKTLGRPVYTHEFAFTRQRLIEELQGKADAPTMEEIIAMIPPEKLIVIKTAK